ncbi:hypothetical protein BKH41_08600 [Helicobacter sp. 12S02232-10]|uniref:hypothetical protein n=1 Tax=Helicobacter sp. 12S02232-10 TaxID=1476197 RepID=UPI000BA6C999|nr:hypothetical protein [Helicobacter sp. 12S02232-10]PAF46759.1 hypothetical protein BKH41_08600 [Helicobacter sp. 12S02232-10]
MNRILFLLTIFVALGAFAFGAGVDDIASAIQSGAESASKKGFAIASIISKTLGVLWVVALLVGAIFARDRIKEHIWGLIGVTVILVLVIAVCEVMK